VRRICFRPYANADEMNWKLIANWNSMVQPDDTVWHLGDFSFMNQEKTFSVLRQLNGKKHFISGNHDKKVTDQIAKSEEGKKLFEFYGQYAEIKVDGQKIVLCHYPILSWNGAGKGSWMLHGHCHNNLNNKGNTRVDVGVDNTIDFVGYRPVSFEEVARVMNKRSYDFVDFVRNDDELAALPRD